MTHSLITRLVVGEPTTLALGQPVGQTLASPSGSVLQWREGSWVGAGRPRLQWLARVLRRREQQAIVVRTAAAVPAASPHFRRNLTAVAVAAVAVGAAIPLAMTAFSAAPSAPGDLPITPAVATAPVQVVAATYMPPHASERVVAPPPLPIATPNEGAVSPLPLALRAPAQALVAARADLPKAPPVPAEHPPSPPAKGSVQKGQSPPLKNAAGTQREQQPEPAVVLDEASPRPGRPAANPPAASAPSSAPAKRPPAAGSAPSAAVAPHLAPSPAVSPQPAPSPAVAMQPAPKPALERGTGLIAITPDSKVAVFTNPNTRLPQQFKIGDQLLSGDTIRSIDAKAGKVISSSKEYSLD